uniref:Transposase n=1 Tax=Heligmosomoides polygyrus TaxID=6339 RepID=A0A183F8A7_HELPZ
LYHVFLGDRTADNWQEYQKAKKAAKKAVAVAKATHYGDVYRKLESRDGERYLYRIAKTRHRQTEDIEKVPFERPMGITEVLVDPRKNYGLKNVPLRRRDEDAALDGWSLMDRIGNDAIRQKFGVAPIADKMREARLRWYGHVLYKKEDSIRKIVLEPDMSAKRPRGRPKQRSSDTLHMDMKVTGVHPDQAQDREGWRHDTRRADPATKRD